MTTTAYNRFKILIDRTNKLIEAGNIGIEKEIGKHQWIIEKFGEIKAPKGRKPKNYKPEISGERLDNENMSLTMDNHSAFLLKTTMMNVYGEAQDLNSHLNSIMTVYIWASFETYLYMLFKELFNKRPEMLKTGTSISYKEVIENKNRIFELIVEKELESIGHFSLDEYLKYLEKKLNLSFDKPIQDKLKQFYIIRNIVAHNTGIISPRLKTSIPKSIKIKNDEILVSKKYLENSSQFIGSIVNKIEKHVDKKINKTAANIGIANIGA